MAKLTTAQKLVGYERLAATISGAGMGFWAAAIFMGRGIPMERFMLMCWIATSLMLCGPVVGLFAKWRVGKATHAQG